MTPAINDTGPCFFCPELPAVGAQAWLPEEEAHHAAAARRLRAGDVIGLIDGKGTLASAVVDSISHRSLAFTVTELNRVAAPSPALVVASAIPKGERFRVLLDMLSQIGVAGIVPLVCERGAVKPRRPARERWRRIAIEGCKQSRNPWVPEIDDPSSVGESLDRMAGDSVLVYLDVDGGDPQRVAGPGGGALYLYVGPEGGFSEAEKASLRDRGGRALKLGDNVLRVETAAVAGAVLGLLGDIDR